MLLVPVLCGPCYLPLPDILFLTIAVNHSALGACPIHLFLNGTLLRFPFQVFS